MRSCDGSSLRSERSLRGCSTTAGVAMNDRTGWLSPALIHRPAAMFPETLRSWHAAFVVRATRCAWSVNVGIAFTPWLRGVRRDLVRQGRWPTGTHGLSVFAYADQVAGTSATGLAGGGPGTVPIEDRRRDRRTAFAATHSFVSVSNTSGDSYRTMFLPSGIGPISPRKTGRPRISRSVLQSSTPICMWLRISGSELE